MYLKIDELAKRTYSNIFYVEVRDDAPSLQMASYARQCDRFGNIYLQHPNEDGFLKTGWRAELIDASLFQDEKTMELIAPEKVVEVAGYVVQKLGFFVTTTGYVCDHKNYRQLLTDHAKTDMDKFELNYYINEQKHIEYVGPCIKITDFSKPVAFIRPYLREQAMNMGAMYGIDITYLADVINPVTYMYRSGSYHMPGLASFGRAESQSNQDSLFTSVFSWSMFQPHRRVAGTYSNKDFWEVTEDDLNNVEVWVYRKDIEYVWPNFYDPIDPKVRIKKIIGNHYFLSDNGYVCNTDAYEPFDWKKHKSRMIL